MGGIQRGSPGWGDPDPPGMGGQDGSSGWGPKPPGPSGPKKMVTAEMVWSSRQFRMLCDMGISKGDAESALRQTSLNLEDALELLTSHGRMPGGMGGRNGPSGGPPSGDSPFQPPGPAGGNNPYNSRRDFGNGPGGMPFPTDSGPGQPGLTPPLPGFNPMNGPKMGGPGSNGLIPGGNNSLRQPGNVAAAPNSGNNNKWLLKKDRGLYTATIKHGHKPYITKERLGTGLLFHLFSQNSWRFKLKDFF